jgi:hypothetical protein
MGMVAGASVGASAVGALVVAACWLLPQAASSQVIIASVYPILFTVVPP